MNNSVAVPALDAWRPLNVEEAQRAFDRTAARWWVAGGYAVDLFLGHETRAHADIDIAVLRSEHETLVTLQPEFELFIMHDGAVRPWDERALAAREHQFWARRRDDDAWAFEVLLEESGDDVWRYRRDERITAPLDAFGTRTAHGIPYVRAEIALLYKSNNLSIERNSVDFAVAAPVLEASARASLRSALEITAPGHPWLAALG